MSDYFDGKVGGGGGGKKGAAKKSTKEDKATFLARTQATRQNRQHNKKEESSATTIQSLWRRARCLTAARAAAAERLAALAAAPSAAEAPSDHLLFRPLATQVRLLWFSEGGITRVHRSPAGGGGGGGGGDAAESHGHASGTPHQLEAVVGRLVESFTGKGGSGGGYAQHGLEHDQRVVSLQLRRICSIILRTLTRKGWAKNAVLLKSLLLLSDPALWASVPPNLTPTAVTVCHEVQHHLVTSSSLYPALRVALLDPEEAGASTLLWTLALRPLSAKAGGSAGETEIARAFAAEMVTIPSLLDKLPAVLHPSLTHQTIWPRILFSLGSAGAQSAGQELSGEAALAVLGNVVEMTQLGAMPGLQMLYLSALQRLLDRIPPNLFSLPAKKAIQRQAAALYSPGHVHWLLCGIGARDAAPRGGARCGELATLTWAHWAAAFADVRTARATDGRAKHTEAIGFFCGVYARLLRVWVGCNVQILNALSFDSPVHTFLWAWLRASASLQEYIDKGTGAEHIGDVVFLFCKSFLHRLMVTDDTEFYDQQIPLPLNQLVDASLLLRQYVNRRFWGAEAPARFVAFSGDDLRRMQREAAAQLMHQLYDRNARREFCPLDTWLQKGFKMDAFGMDSTEADSRTLVVLNEFPHVIPLTDRVRVFQKLIEEDRVSRAWPETRVTIRRTKIVQDGFAKLGGLRSELKGSTKIHFVNESGLDESGIDMGGLYKEFITAFIEKAFSPDFGLFKFSPERQLYPNPDSHMVSSHLDYFSFIGRVLGKALFDGIQVDLPFCGFFISKLLGKHNYLDELPSLDPALHKNLMYLKQYDGDVSDLALDFTCAADEVGGIHNLIPNGADVEVTAANRIQYIHLMADFRLNRQIKKQCDAFLRGFQDVIRVEWIRFFNPVELQVLISGEKNGDFAVQDLMAHTVYSGGYSAGDSSIKKLWKVVTAFSPKDKCALLKFVTSCPRAPVLGFSTLQPPFCVHRVHSERGMFDFFTQKDETRLPTASTCMNLLKLPPYISTSALRDKLLYAIHSNAGFELS